MTDQLGKTETYGYDKMNNLISLTDRKGQITAYTYDFLSRLVNGQYADGSAVSYSYDAGGRLTTISDTISGMISLSYDNLDRVVNEITSLGSISYEYNAIGRRTKMQVAGQEPVMYQYNSNSRLIQINQGTQTVSINHDSIGRRTAMTLPNGIIATYEYDNANRITNITYSSSLILKALNYVYDNNGNRTSFSGHKTLLPEPKTASYNQANQQIQVDNETLLYDENGNLIQKGDAIYTWNARNQLVAITSPTYNASFKYDALGRRIEKTINAKTINYLHDGWDIIQEIENGTVTTNYLRSLNIDETLGIQKQGSIYYYLTDALGSTIALTDPSRNIATEYYYDPFGNTQTSNPNIYNPFQYTGRENDGNGYYHYRLRTKLGERFISQDPAGLLGGINFYSYTANNPVNFIDVWGLKPGDKFKTADAAAIDFTDYIIAKSNKENREYGSFIYRNQDLSYSYTVPKAGTSHHVRPSEFNKPPIGTSEEIIAHTHTGDPTDPLVYSFGTDDTFTAAIWGEMYFGAKGGLVKAWNPWTGERTVRCGKR